MIIRCQESWVDMIHVLMNMQNYFTIEQMCKRLSMLVMVLRSRTGASASNHIDSEIVIFLINERNSLLKCQLMTTLTSTLIYTA